MEEVGVLISQGLSSTPRPTDSLRGRPPVGGSDREVEFIEAGTDRDPRESGGLGDPSDPTPPDCSGFRGGPEAAHPLIEHGLKAGVLRSDGLHHEVLHTSHPNIPGHKSDRLLWRETPYPSPHHFVLFAGRRPKGE